MITNIIRSLLKTWSWEVQGVRGRRAVEASTHDTDWMVRGE